MKKKIAFFLLSLYLLLSACACAPQTLHTVEMDGKSFEIDTLEKTVFDGKYTYDYKVSGNTERYSITIKFPDGATYTSDFNGMITTGTASYSFEPRPYAKDSTLVSVIKSKDLKKPIKDSLIKWFSVLFFIGAGLFFATNPDVVWEMRYGWHFKNAAPSEDGLLHICIGGIILIILGVVMIFVM